MLPFPGKIVVGITGGIACGKSKVCQKFGELGWEVISTDSCSHYFLNKDKIVIKAILEKFGTGIKDLNGNIDKSKLARLIFNSHYDRAWLESLLHPLVRDRWMSAIKLSASSKFVVEVPLLYENNLHAQFTKTISVHVSKSIQIQRLEKRGLSANEIDSRIDAQMPVDEKSNLADFVILAESNPQYLIPQIKLFTTFLKT